MAIRIRLVVVWIGVWCCGAPAIHGQPAATNAANAVAVIMELEGKVLVQRSGAKVWDPAYTNQFLFVDDRLRTAKEARTLLRLSDQSAFRVGELSDLVLERAGGANQEPTWSLLRGLLYFFHRDRPGTYRVRTPTASAAVRGTEFNLESNEDGTTILTVLDGDVELAGEVGGPVHLKGDPQGDKEQGVVDHGKAAAKRPLLVAKNDVIQWCLHYPAVLDLNEFDFTAEERDALQASLSAYRNGDILDALEKYPTGRSPSSADEKVYRVALLMAVGQLPSTDFGELAGQNTRVDRLVTALKIMAATVKDSSAAQGLIPGRGPGDPFANLTASECVAVSYAEQAQLKLESALHAARLAAEKSPGFGFAWERIAELEFSFGHNDQAMKALGKALELSPRNAQAHALNGFVLAAQNKIAAAMRSFDQAIAIDGSLGDAWLGRGLCRIRQGQVEAGRQDLLAAAALEPQRALLRSYLGKAYSAVGDGARAANELRLAKILDSHDPTSWLYSALLNEQGNRINEAVEDLERSQQLNDNRRLYRSRLLLDQDRAVRSANLANIYLDAGMREVSVREAVQAVNADYANYSAHFFLANSYNSLRDPKQINLRYETPWLSEYLLANLLAPAGAGTLSQAVSQQEYSKLFERDRVGIVSSTEYFSRGDWVQSGAQFGTFGNSSYAIDSVYRSENGQRSNNDQDQLTLSLQLKQQFTPQDSAYLQVVYYRAHAGDLLQYYDPAAANQTLRTKETQEPLLITGYHHEWSPESHTLILVGRMQDSFELTNSFQSVLSLAKRENGQVFRVSKPIPTAALNYQSEVVLVPVELQQLWHYADHQMIVGGRYQTGQFDTRSQLGSSTRFYFGDNPNAPLFSSQASQDQIHPYLERISAYAYDSWQVVAPLRLMAGLSYDRLTAPLNFRSPPLLDGEETRDQFSPKAGLILNLAKNTVLRAAYTRSLGGVTFDQSFRLEPSQVAGFNQSFRSLIPESVAGALSAPTFETAGVALDQKFQTGTYLGLEANLLKSRVRQQIGTFDWIGFSPAQPSSTDEQLDFEEKSLALTVNQLVGDFWSLGLRYQLSDAELHTRLPEIPTAVLSSADSRVSSVLNQVNLYALLNHPSGFFAQADALWMAQSNQGYQPDRPGDDFWQFNLYAGYRFARRHAEVRLGLLNITDRDYRLNPLNLTSELPRHRTLTASFKFYF